MKSKVSNFVYTSLTYLICGVLSIMFTVMIIPTSATTGSVGLFVVILIQACIISVCIFGGLLWFCSELHNAIVQPWLDSRKVKYSQSHFYHKLQEGVETFSPFLACDLIEAINIALENGYVLDRAEQRQLGELCSKLRADGITRTVIQ